MTRTSLFARFIADLFLLLTLVCIVAAFFPSTPTTGGPRLSLEDIVGEEKLSVVCEKEQPGLSHLKQFDYTQWYGSMGSTSHDVSTYHDEDGNKLFALEYIGNQDLVKIGDTVYQMSERHDST